MHPYFLTDALFGGLVRRHVHVSGAEYVPRRACVFAANHIDYLDGHLIALTLAPLFHRRMFFISRTNNYWFYRSTIALESGSSGQAVAQAAETLRRGYPICVFVEGRRNSAPTLLPSRSGAARIALATGLPVVPIGLIGPSGRTFMESLQYVRRNTQPLSLRIGPELSFTAQSDPDPERVQSVTRDIMVAIASVSGKALPS